MFIAAVFFSFGVLDGGILGWIVAAGAGALLAAGMYFMVKRPPRVTVTPSGIEWSYAFSRRKAVSWEDVVSIREVKQGRWPARRRILAIKTRAHMRGPWLTRLLFRADRAVYTSGLDQPADAVLTIVEQFSGQRIARLR